jgi:hypothetical protein
MSDRFSFFLSLFSLCLSFTLVVVSLSSLSLFSANISTLSASQLVVAGGCRKREGREGRILRAQLALQQHDSLRYQHTPRERERQGRGGTSRTTSNLVVAVKHRKKGDEGPEGSLQQGIPTKEETTAADAGPEAAAEEDEEKTAS